MDERQQEIDYLQRLTNYYRTAADNYLNMFGRTEQWHEMEKTAINQEASLIRFLEKS